MANLYPIFLDLRNALCLVVGGGKVAERKVEGLLQAGARRIVLISPTAMPRIRQWTEVEWIRRKATVDDLRLLDDHAGVRLVFLCTSLRALQREMARACRERSILCNVADAPEESAFLLGSVLRRGAIQIGCSTGGDSPLLAKQLRDVVANVVDPAYAVLSEIVAEVRQADMRRRLPVAQRRARMERLLDGRVLESVRRDGENAARDLVHQLLNEDHRPGRRSHKRHSP